MMISHNSKIRNSSKSKTSCTSSSEIYSSNNSYIHQVVEGFRSWSPSRSKRSEDLGGSTLEVSGSYGTLRPKP